MPCQVASWVRRPVRRKSAGTAAPNTAPSATDTSSTTALFHSAGQGLPRRS